MSEKKSVGVPCYGGSQKGGKTWNEDSFFHWSSKSGKVVVGGIFDGHGGYNGLLASTTARDFSLNFLKSKSSECEKWNAKKWKEVMVQMFADIHKAIRQRFLKGTGSDGKKKKEKRYADDKGIVRNSSQDPIHGGSTGTMTTQFENSNGNRTLITVNVGDSTGVLVVGGKKHDWQFLTTDHGPENQDEWNRVDALPAKDYPYKLMFVYDKTNVFRKYECPTVFLKDGTKNQVYVANPWGNGLHPTNVRYEPAVYAVTPREITKDSTCIAMTRSLGDFYAHQFGLCATPSVGEVEMKADQEYSVFLGSDGIWDCWKYGDFSEHCNDLLTKYDNDVLKAGQVVLDETIKRAITNFGSKHYDDAALVSWYQPSTKKKD